MFVGATLLLLVSCVDLVAPSPIQLPCFKLLSTEIDSSGTPPLLTLCAELESETDVVSECGFMLGERGQSLKKYPSIFNGGRFKIYDISLNHDTEYIFKAYIGNGHNVVYSDTDTLIAPPYKAPSSQPLPIRYLEISPYTTEFYFYRTLIDGSCSCPWMSGHNYFGDSGDVVYLCIECESNVSLESRTATINLKEDGMTYQLQIKQHSCLDIIEFQCPEVKKACVALWDQDGDGEISYEEANLVIGMRKEDFADYEITSFNELRHFNGALTAMVGDPVKEEMVYVSAGLFEGSSLSAVSVNVGAWVLPARIFKDCRNLEIVYVGLLEVSEESFMNCVSLTEIKACVNGKSAFMGCTGLKSAVQHYTGVPEMAFKGCTSLENFIFEPLSTYTSHNGYIHAIGKEAFYDCISLTCFAVPREFSSILDRAFYGCSSLKSISFESTQPPTLGADVFQGVNSDMKILVPPPLVERYKKAWPDLAERIIGQD